MSIFTRRMTNDELSRWLRAEPTREYIYSLVAIRLYKRTAYKQAEEANTNVLIRENDSEWRVPLRTGGKQYEI